jgi:hypothetical protein
MEAKAPVPSQAASLSLPPTAGCQWRWRLHYQCTFQVSFRLSHGALPARVHHCQPECITASLSALRRQYYLRATGTYTGTGSGLGTGTGNWHPMWHVALTARQLRVRVAGTQPHQTGSGFGGGGTTRSFCLGWGRVMSMYADKSQNARTSVHSHAPAHCGFCCLLTGM